MKNELCPISEKTDYVEEIATIVKFEVPLFKSNYYLDWIEDDMLDDLSYQLNNK